MTMVKIPTLTFEDVTTIDFRAQCLEAFLPKDKPKFKVGDVVLVTGDFGRKLPGTIIAVGACSKDASWSYAVARPRLSDAVLERITPSEKHLTLIEAAPEVTK